MGNNSSRSRSKSRETMTEREWQQDREDARSIARLCSDDQIREEDRRVSADGFFKPAYSPRSGDRLAQDVNDYKVVKEEMERRKLSPKRR